MSVATKTIQELDSEDTFNWAKRSIPTIYNWITNPPVYRPDPLGANEYMVDRAGYIPAKQQIENLIAAGEGLEIFRARTYTNTEIPGIEPLDMRLMDEMDINDALKERVRRIQIAQELALRETKTVQKSEQLKETSQVTSQETVKKSVQSDEKSKASEEGKS